MQWPFLFPTAAWTVPASGGWRRPPTVPPHPSWFPQRSGGRGETPVISAATAVQVEGARERDREETLRGRTTGQRAVGNPCLRVTWHRRPVAPAIQREQTGESGNDGGSGGASHQEHRQPGRGREGTEKPPTAPPKQTEVGDKPSRVRRFWEKTVATSAGTKFSPESGKDLVFSGG